ncbi:2-octaprenyl-6-methoxyphenol hydroxylase [Devosia enhydra]|uniref:2-octaprenyl-6-methoxyphenol hydroxylase n=1 Tax=Devosia enhydra TaxID=665118 RepID=A0A1K2HYM3_9HYPH|nr:FAD-dependent monooxygenase [Devosia enhydra]SFZ85100.1 2-octaprenyl-6-methoxyphenol hydroxylase [Devosia enhydra]
MPANTDADYDVAIVGGGPVGLALAIALADGMDGIRIALLDRRPLSVPRDQRASTIAAGVRKVLDGLGVWPGVAGVASPVRAMRITDSGTGDIARPLFLSFSGDVAPGEPFAHLVPNTALAEALLARLGDRAEIIAPVTIAGFAADRQRGRLTLADGRTISAALVVAADGAMSGLRGMAGIGVVTHDYRQTGLVATIGHEHDHEGIAYEHFRPAGPFASLPLLDSDGRGLRSSLVWTESAPEAARLAALPLAEAASAIEAAMGSALGAVTLEGALQSYPLRLILARSFIAERLALVGDAAHVVHPIAGQGLNLGLKDVAALAETVLDALRLGLDPGQADTLERYQRWRRLDTALMAMVTDGMNRLFSNDVAPLRAIRDLGLGVVDRLPPVKGALMARAAGLDAQGPRLLRGLPA